jgi:hypothetical protein
MTWLINGVTPASLGLAVPRITEGNLTPDVLTLDHLTAAWDADPIFAYAQTLTLTRAGVTVFVGKVRRFPRFAGPTAETTSYEVLGPWDWLERRILQQNQAVVVDPATSTIPTLVPQGLIILNQSDAGATVTISQALTTVINQAISVGVPILLGTIVGFDYSMSWDEVADLTHADAIIRLLASAPDAVVRWDYTTTTGGVPTPTIHIGRRANLSAVLLAIAPANTPVSAFEAGTYASFETVRLTSRPDLVISGAHLTYRRVNTVNGETFLRLEQQTAGPGSKTDENALVRTVQLAGSSFTETVLEQECKSTPLPSGLGTGTLTASGDIDQIVKFLRRGGNAEINSSNPFWYPVKLEGMGREAMPVTDDDGAESTPALDTSLTRELLEGGITPWMEDTGLNRKGQVQQVSYRVHTPSGQYDLTRQFLATNVATRTYSYQESSDYTPPESTPSGLAATLYAAMSVLQHEGSFVLVARECAFTVRVGMVVNLTGGRAEWATMKAVVQSVVHDLTEGRTEVTVGWPRHITVDELMSIMRNNRLKFSAARGLIRTTGKL